jgi:hypothetical protein
MKAIFAVSVAAAGLFELLMLPFMLLISWSVWKQSSRATKVETVLNATEELSFSVVYYLIFTLHWLYPLSRTRAIRSTLGFGLDSLASSSRQ